MPDTTAERAHDVRASPNTSARGRSQAHDDARRGEPPPRRARILAVPTGGRAPPDPGSVARHRLGSIVGTESFYVEDAPGPLVDGEVERARTWGRALAARRT